MIARVALECVVDLEVGDEIASVVAEHRPRYRLRRFDGTFGSWFGEDP
jgi:hypothetical protein